MSEERKPNDVKIVAWFMAAKNVIKFLNDDTTYKLGEAVIKASNFEKFPLCKGDRVEVGIKEGVVTFLRKQKSEAKGTGSEEAYEPTPDEEKPKTTAPAPKVVEPEVKKETATTSEPQSPGSRELTVFAVAANRKVVKFLEIKDSGWYQISEAIQAQDYAVIGLQAKNKVMVLLNDKTVVSVAKVVSEPAEQPKTAISSPVNAKVEPTAAPAAQAPVQAPSTKSEYVPKTEKDAFYYIKELERKIRFLEDGKQESFELQASLTAASEIVGRVAASISPAPTANVINSMVSAIAKENYKLLQELKNK